MEKIIEIKVGALHNNAAKKYKKMLEEGIAIAAPVELVKKAAKLEAVIDGTDKIGYANITSEDLPNVYEIKITGITENGDFTAMLTSDGVVSSSSNYEAEKQAVVAKGVVPKEEVDEIVAHLERNRVHKSIILKMLDLMQDATEERCHLGEKEATYEDANPSREFSIFNDILIQVFIKACCILVGPKSTGKNIAAKNVARDACLPFYQLTLNLDTTSDEAFGPRSTDNTALNRLDLGLALARLKVEMMTNAGKYDEIPEELIKKAAEFDLLAAQSSSIHIVQVESALVKWARYGGVLLLDEVNMAEANFLQSILHPLADGTKCLVGPGEIGTIPLHPNCILLAGMNPPTAAYAGTRELNDATASRCAHILFDMPDSVESLLRANFPKNTSLKSKQFKACDEVYKCFKGAVESGRVPDKCLNVRGFVRALEAVEMFPEATKLSHQIKIQILDAITDENQRAILANMLRDKVVI